MHGQQAHPVGEHVMHLPCEPVAFSGPCIGDPLALLGLDGSHTLGREINSCRRSVGVVAIGPRLDDMPGVIVADLATGVAGCVPRRAGSSVRQSATPRLLRRPING
jgi:hypothetical protein